MAKYLYHPEELKQGVQALDFMSCKRIELTGSSPAYAIESGHDEMVFVCLSGAYEYRVGQAEGTARAKDFLYLPWKSKLALQAHENAVLMQVAAPSDRYTAFAHLKFEDVAADPERHKVFGAAETSTRRDVYMFIDDKFKASRLLMGYTEGATGGWTSWPPHEHARDREELYVYFGMGRSFAIQCVYEDLDHPLFLGAVRDGDMVAIPRGYHPNVSCPGGRIAYFYAMAARVAGKREFMTMNVQNEFGEFK